MKKTKKQQRRDAHLLIAGMLWNHFMDGDFGESDSVASDVAIATINNHCKMGGTTFADAMKNKPADE